KKFNGKLNKSTLSRYENNLQEPMLTVVRNLAEILDVDINFLTDDETTSTPIETFPSNIYKVELKKFPLLENVACGEPIWAEEDRTSYIMANSDIKADFCLVAKGDSMINARILDGDIVFIKEMPIVKDGEIGAIIIDNETTLKRVYYNKEDNMLTLVPENPTCRTFRYQNEELDNIRILGKAVYFTSKMR
ncbi:MAG: S24 family peptidase, partial [Oscillospiraceae bacterium]